MSNPLLALADLLEPAVPLIPELQGLKEHLSIGPYAVECARWEAKRLRKNRRGGVPDIEESALALLRQKMEALAKRSEAPAGDNQPQVTVALDPDELRLRVKDLELKERTNEGLTTAEQERLVKWRAELKSHRSALAQEVQGQSDFSRQQAATEAERRLQTLPDSVRADRTEVGMDVTEWAGGDL